MNPLVQDMLFAQHREDLELRNLEGLLEDECKCEANHIILLCTGKVVGLHISECTGNRYCDEPAADCWTIRPI